MLPFGIPFFSASVNLCTLIGKSLRVQWRVKEVGTAISYFQIFLEYSESRVCRLHRKKESFKLLMLFRHQSTITPHYPIIESPHHHEY
jgi:hypothetical protein